MQNVINEKPTSKLYGRLKFTTQFVDYLDIKEKNILNIGCGYGWFELNAINRNVKKIIGTEISEKDLETANINIKNKNVEFNVSSAIDLPFNNDSFDTVVSWEVIEHIPKNTEKQMFSEAYRVLKKDGVFYLSTPYDNFFAKIFDPAWYFGHRHYSLDRLKKFAESNGFIVDKYYKKGGLWEVIAMLDMYISKWIFRRRMFFESFILKKVDEEYSKPEGFFGIFIKFRKV
jgi:cyclopropane fatty-acyl-phospholipid synthase-like methyltransferase